MNNEQINNNSRESKKLILDIMKDKYTLYFTRSNSFDSKAIGAITFHAAIIFFTVSQNISQYLTKNSSNLFNSLLYVLNFFLPIFILITSFVSILLFILAIKSSDIKILPASLTTESYYNSEINSLMDRLLNAHSDAEKHNNKVLQKKHKLFNNGISFTILNLALIILYKLITIL